MKLIKFLLAVISIFLYVRAPLVYDQGFCIICMLLFFIECLILVIPDFKNKEYISFNVLFLFSMFWVSFAYPVFIHGTAAAWLGVISEHINWDVLSKVTALSLVFISFYTLGYSNSKHIVSSVSRYDSNRLLYTSKICLTLTFVILILAGIIFLNKVGWNAAGIDISQFLYDFFYIFIILCVLFSSKNNISEKSNLKAFIKNNLLVSFATVIFLLFYLLVGDRGPAIRVVLILFMLFYRYNPRVKLSRIIIIACAGIALMFFIRQTREYSETSLVNNGVSAISNSDVFEFGEEGAVYMFADLFGIERELCIGYDYVSKHGVTHTEKILIIPLYAIPFLPTIILSIFGLETDDYSTGYILNDYFAEYNPKFGTHIVIDLYMCFGLIGVVFFAFVLGVFTSTVYRKRMKSIYWTTVYIILFSFAIYLPRDSMFSLVRPLSLTFITVYILTHRGELRLT